MVGLYNGMKQYIDPYITQDVVGMFAYLGEHPEDFRTITEMYGRMSAVVETLEASCRSDTDINLELAFRGVSEIVNQLSRALSAHSIPAFITEMDSLVTKKDLAIRQFEAAVDKKNKDFESILARLREISREVSPVAKSDEAVLVSLALPWPLAGRCRAADSSPRRPRSSLVRCTLSWSSSPPTPRCPRLRPRPRSPAAAAARCTPSPGGARRSAGRR